MIQYSIVMRKNPLKKDAPLKAHATAQSKKVMTLDDIAKHITDHGSVYDRSVISGVVIKVAECLREQLLAGNQVVLGDLGKFELSLDCEGADSAADFTSKNIKDVKVRWRASDNLKNLRKEAKFKQNLTRQAEKNALDALEREDGEG